MGNVSVVIRLSVYIVVSLASTARFCFWVDYKLLEKQVGCSGIKCVCH